MRGELQRLDGLERVDVTGIPQWQCNDAAAATLDNVRERCLRAEAAWAAMAERGERSDAMRAGREKAVAEG